MRPGASAQLDGGRRCISSARPPGAVRAALATGLALAAIFAGLLPPTSAGATLANATDASRLAREAAQELTIVDEQVHEATITVAAQQDAAEAAAVQAAAAQAALSVFEPQLRAIAQSGYTGKSQSRVAPSSRATPRTSSSSR